MIARISQPPLTVNEGREPQPAAPHCFCWQRWGNQAVRVLRGNKAALMRAAGNNDVTTIKRILSARPWSHTVDPNIRHGKKNRTPATKAAAHGNSEALSALLKFGASAKDVMTMSRWEGEYKILCHGGVIFDHYIEPVCNYTPQIIKTLLEDHDADPNTPYGISDISNRACSEMTSLERLNMTSLINWDPDKTGRLSLQFARDPRTNLNSAIDFDRVLSFPGTYSLKSKSPTFPATPALINLLGQAFLFKNTPLIEFLLDDDRVNPGLPAGTAENLIDIIANKLMYGYYFNFLPKLKTKLLGSQDFCDALIRSTNGVIKQQFLLLIEFDPSRGSFVQALYLNADLEELNRKIANLYPTFEPDFGGATENHPGKKITR